MRRERRSGCVWKDLGLGVLGGLAGAAADETLVPASGLAGWSRQYPLSAHLYALASHVVFGVATDTAIRLGR